MDINTLLILSLIGVAAGVVSGFVGVGGGIIIVPALVFLLGQSQHMAQGTSLALMLPPIGVLAVYNYYKDGSVNFQYAAVIALAFIIGGFIGSKLSLKMSPYLVKFIFGLIMLYAAIRMIISGIKYFK